MDGWRGSLTQSHTGRTGDFLAVPEVHVGQLQAPLERLDRTWLNVCGEGVRSASCATTQVGSI